MSERRASNQRTSVPLDLALQLYDASCENGSRIGPFGLSSEQAVRIIAAADIKLHRWERPVEPNWLAVHADPVVDHLAHLDMRYRGAVKFETRRSEHWIVATTGHVFRQVRDECTKYLVATSKKYQFNESGALIRVRSADYVANTVEETAVQVRSMDATTTISDEEVLGVMAALLREFDQIRFSLIRPSIKQHEELVAAGKRYLAKLGRYVARRPRHLSAELVHALCSRLTEDFDGLREVIETLPHPKEARARFMGPSQVAFRLLFGMPATTHYDLVGVDPKQEADSPFIRFVDALFTATGCPCSKNTINRALADCRAAQPGRRKGRQRGKLEFSGNLPRSIGAAAARK